MKVLVDTSVWIDYFQHGRFVPEIRGLLEQQRLVTNDVVLAELLPVLRHDKKDAVAELLLALECLPVLVDWEDLVHRQVKCLKNGFNKVGLLDLMILQTALEHGVEIFSLDKHFQAFGKLFKVGLFRHSVHDA